MATLVLKLNSAKTVEAWCRYWPGAGSGAGAGAGNLHRDFSNAFRVIPVLIRPACQVTMNRHCTRRTICRVRPGAPLLRRQVQTQSLYVQRFCERACDVLTCIMHGPRADRLKQEAQLLSSEDGLGTRPFAPRLGQQAAWDQQRQTPPSPTSPNSAEEQYNARLQATQTPLCFLAAFLASTATFLASNAAFLACAATFFASKAADFAACLPACAIAAAYAWVAADVS